MSTTNILAIHDLSCFGRCSLSVIIPTLSAMGHQVTALPTALLSTHTGGFENMTFYDLSDTMLPNFRHMLASNAHFDAIYPGFLGNAGQIDTVSEIIDSLPEAFVFVDPVMGDDGVLYQTYTKALCERMRELCAKAHAITPNFTEACLLLGRDYIKTSEKEAAEVAELTAEMTAALHRKYGCNYIALTGAECREGKLKYVCTAALSNGSFEFIKNPCVGASYPGTGDIFASVLLGDILSKKDFVSGAHRASVFVRECALDTYNAQTAVRDGVLLEKNLFRLI